jgi:hypothetical protein
VTEMATDKAPRAEEGDERKARVSLLTSHIGGARPLKRWNNEKLKEMGSLR